MTSSASLITFFDLDSPHVRKEGLAAFAATGALRGIQTLLTAAPPILQTHIGESITDALKTALDVRIVDILTQAWSARRDLAPYTDEPKYPANQIIDHTLTKHEIHSVHKPRVQIMLDHSPLGPEMEFDVALSLNIDSAVLRVKNRRIMSARLGRITGVGTIKCEGATLFQRPTKSVALPLTISFGAGIPIGKTKNAAVADAA
jgi:hypothetical protein